jgi:hypothetical protein
MRFCCDEQCEQGRNCPAKPPTVPDWCDAFALGVCVVSFVTIVLFLVFRP